MKPIGFLTNSKHIARELSRRCPRDHAHVPLVGGRAAAAAIYPHNLCCAICRGLARQLKEDAGWTIDSPLLDTSKLKSLMSLFMEATTAGMNEAHKERHDETCPDNCVPNVLQSLTSMLRSTVSQFTPDLNPLTGLPRSEEVTRSYSVKSACISNEFGLTVIRIEAEGSRAFQADFAETKI